MTAGELAEWAAAVDPEMLIVLGDRDDYVMVDSDVRAVSVEKVVHREYIYLWSDEPGLGWVMARAEETFPCEEMGCDGCEEGAHVWYGTPVWRLGDE